MNVVKVKVSMQCANARCSSEADTSIVQRFLKGSGDEGPDSQDPPTKPEGWHAVAIPHHGYICHACFEKLTDRQQAFSRELEARGW